LTHFTGAGRIRFRRLFSQATATRAHEVVGSIDLSDSSGPTAAPMFITVIE
jgi:hypothetical protein